MFLSFCFFHVTSFVLVNICIYIYVYIVWKTATSFGGKRDLKVDDGDTNHDEEKNWISPMQNTTRRTSSLKIDSGIFFLHNSIYF